MNDDEFLVPSHDVHEDMGISFEKRLHFLKKRIERLPNGKCDHLKIELLTLVERIDLLNAKIDASIKSKAL